MGKLAETEKRWKEMQYPYDELSFGEIWNDVQYLLSTVHKLKGAAEKYKGWRRSIGYPMLPEEKELYKALEGL